MLKRKIIKIKSLIREAVELENKLAYHILNDYVDNGEDSIEEVEVDAKAYINAMESSDLEEVFSGEFMAILSIRNYELTFTGNYDGTISKGNNDNNPEKQTPTETSIHYINVNEIYIEEDNDIFFESKGSNIPKELLSKIEERLSDTVLNQLEDEL